MSLLYKLLVVQVTTRFAVKDFFSYESFHARKKKNQVPTSYLLQDSPLSFFCPTSRSSQESEGFFFQRATYKGRWSTGSQGSRWVRQGWSVTTKGGHEKEKKRKRKTKEGGLSPQEGDVRKIRKEKKRKRPSRREGGSSEGKVPCALNQESLFFGSRVFGFGSGPSRLKYRLLRDLVYKEAMCKGSSGNGLPYTAKAVP
jgi:hypothetical protein